MNRLASLATSIASCAILWLGTSAALASADADGDGLPDARLNDITRDEGFGVTEGLDLVWKLQADRANVAISSVGAELANMRYYDTEYRWPAVHGSRGQIRLKVPRAGRFYPALVVYDTDGRETYELLLEGKRLGRFVAAEDDRRQRIHFLQQPVEFRGGETLVWRTGSVGSHITEDVLLLAEQPPVRKRRFDLGQLQAGDVNEHGGAQMRVTWITTWPAACTVEYGPTIAYGRKLVEAQPVANHRVYVADAPRGMVHYRIVAPRPDGTRLVGPDQVFRFEPPAPTVGAATRSRLPLKVENPYPFALPQFPVTSGVPFAKGELGGADRVRLLNPQGQEVTFQPKVTARWPDGSVKWLLVSLLATVDRQTTAQYTLEYGNQVRREPAASRLKVQGTGPALVVDTGPLRVEFDAGRSGFPVAIGFDADGDGRFAAAEGLAGQPIAAQVADADGKTYRSAGAPATMDVEESGPVRIVLKLTGRHANGKAKCFAYVTRFTFYAGSPLVRMEYTWENDAERPGLTAFESIGLDVPLPAGPRPKWTVGLGRAQTASGAGEFALSQLHDKVCTVTPTPAAAKCERADGWVDLSGQGYGFTLVVRDFWQLYPKAFRLAADRLRVDLCPDFPKGTYDSCTELEQVKLYHYLMGGQYRVMQGVRKQHELWLGFHRGGFTPAAAEIAQAAQEPLVAVCSPERYASTGVFGEILPSNTGRFPAYEKVCGQVLQAYLRHRDSSHEYGMLNFGDQWGERKVNWANGEYDHHHAMLLEFARSGDRRWYFLGEKAARHAIDVDTCHYGPRQGGEWIHSMGHTGGYFTRPYQGDGIPGPGMSVSHTWTEGCYDWYFLSGDATAAENGAAVADYYDGAYLNNYDWGNCRTNGWHLLLTLAAWRATGDPFYLNAARIIVDRTLERQSPAGGWHRQMVPGHCYDLPRHRGEANFMLGVLANGLEGYYREVPDQAVAEAILGGARQVVRELWVEQAVGFRYTSCPNMTGYTANNDMVAEMLFAAHRLGDNPEYARIVMKAMEAAFRAGIGSIAHLRWTPHLIYNMDLIRRGVKTPLGP